MTTKRTFYNALMSAFIFDSTRYHARFSSFERSEIPGLGNPDVA
ncbi:hypothetical protein SAMN04487868_12360 [Marinobacter salarius]|uniref:Uncharacterized protein n=1 Tax=Marinobacter salarius TaxID=1420917 RepID=A0ABY1FT58_9GAMM|nr:hypothetical protein SAMN04487868_12360 [Marinobacter salarius]